MMKKSLGGKRKNYVLEFEEESLKMRFYTEFNENSIRVLLFEVDLVDLRQNPLNHIQNMLRTVSKNNRKYMDQAKLIK